jgi:hypothetical protein
MGAVMPSYLLYGEQDPLAIGQLRAATVLRADAARSTAGWIGPPRQFYGTPLSPRPGPRSGLVIFCYAMRLARDS